MKDFRRIYPGEGKILFDGGLNNKFEKSIIEDNESPDCLNVVFDAGSVATRLGFSKVNTTSVGTFVCDGLYTRKGTNNAETMVAFFGGTGYTLAGTTFTTIASAQSVFTAGVRIHSAQMENHAFFGNGNVIPYKYNGTDWTRHGVYPPSMTVTAYTGAAGNPNGDYRYKITYVNSASVEGNPSDATATFTVANAQISLTCLPIAPQSWGVASRRIYRTSNAGATYYRITTINDNTTTTYLDNTADASLGVAAPSDKGVPPTYSAICYHQNRLFMIGNDNLVWYTDLNEPYTVGSTNFLTVGDQASDLPVSLGVYNNTLAIFCKRSVWLVYMQDTDPANWRQVKSKSPYTSKSPFGIFEFKDRLGFPAIENDKFVGIAALSGDTVEPDKNTLSVLTVGSDLLSQAIEDDMFDAVEAYVGNFSSVVFKNKAYIALTKGTNQTTNNRVYVMDFGLSDLTKRQRFSWAPWSGLNVAQWCVYAGSLYYGTSTATGFVYKQSTDTYSDDGAAINSYYWTKELVGVGDEASYAKDFRAANLLVDLAGAYYMSVAVRTDSDSGDGTNYQVDLDPQASLWGTMVWGRDTWGGGSTQKDVRHFLAGARGKRIQFKFSNQNTAGQRFKVHWMNLTYNLKGPR